MVHKEHCGESCVEVHFFKESGKWYATEQIDWDGLYNEPLIHDAFRIALKRQLKGRFEEMWAVCITPYHQNSHPITIKDW